MNNSNLTSLRVINAGRVTLSHDTANGVLVVTTAEKKTTCRVESCGAEGSRLVISPIVETRRSRFSLIAIATNIFNSVIDFDLPVTVKPHRVDCSGIAFDDITVEGRSSIIVTRDMTREARGSLQATVSDYSQLTVECEASYRTATLIAGGGTICTVTGVRAERLRIITRDSARCTVSGTFCHFGLIEARGVSQVCVTDRGSPVEYLMLRAHGSSKIDAEMPSSATSIETHETSAVDHRYTRDMLTASAHGASCLTAQVDCMGLVDRTCSGFSRIKICQIFPYSPTVG